MSLQVYATHMVAEMTSSERSAGFDNSTMESMLASFHYK